MANQSQLQILRHDVQEWNQWREAHLDELIDFSDGDLSSINLKGANLSSATLNYADLRLSNLSEVNLHSARLIHAHLTGADLTYANLYRASLNKADLSGANFSNAVLVMADLREASLGLTNFSEADMRGVNLSGADLRGTILARAIFADVTLNNVDLSHVQGILSVIHKGFSSVGIDAFYRSRGQIEEKFLLGCGIPQEGINILRSLVYDPMDATGLLRFPSTAFITYALSDEMFALQIVRDLQAQGIICESRHDFRIKKRRIEIETRNIIVKSDVVIVIFSQELLQGNAIRIIFNNAFQNKKPIIIVMRQRYLLPDWLQAYQRVDFCQVDYQQALTDLLLTIEHERFRY